MNIGVLGCGSLGGVIAGKLQAIGRDSLWVIERKQDILDAVRRNGLEVREDPGSTIVKPRMVSDPEELPEPLDMVILTVKSTSLVAAVEGCMPFLASGGFFVAMQNGLMALDLIERYGREKVLAGCVMWGASIVAPGIYEMTAHGPIIVGSTRGRTVDQSRICAGALKGAFPVMISADMKDALWAKLTVTASLTTLGAVTGLDFGDMLERRDIRDLVIRVGKEVVAVGRASGVPFRHVKGVLNVNLLAGGRLPPDWLKHIIIGIIGSKHRKTRSSMLASILEGVPTEIDHINGQVVRLGESHGRETPVNRCLVEIVKAIEAGSLAPGDECLARLFDCLDKG
jgi:2-dehydropantoate 2-reductase